MTHLPTIERGAHSVLVVDDNPVTRYATSRVLRAAGFDILETDTGAGAVRLASKAVSAVVLDVHLPDIDGLQACIMIRARPETSSLPVVHLSAAYVGDQDKVKGLNVGANAYLTHPVEPAVLIATVHVLIRAHAADEAMRQSEARFRAIYDQALGGICLLDEAGRFVDVNPAMLRMLQLQASDMLGHMAADFAPPDWEERVREITAAAHRGVWRGEFPLVDATGAIVYLEWSMSSRLESGLIVATASNISERVLLERQREHLLEREQAARASAERLGHMKDTFIAVLSHELRTPLSVIMGWTHILLKLGGAPNTIRGLESIERNAKLQTRLISDLLDVSRLNLGKLRLEREMVNAAELVMDSMPAMQLTAQEKQVTLEQHVENADQMSMWLDPARFQQILWNLVTNAIKFSSPNGVVHVSLQTDAAGLKLCVKDEGQGIKPDFLPHLFDRFSQSESANTRSHSGLGLGLSIVKHLVELHGGSVDVKSKGVGHGATFEVTIPATVPLLETEEARGDLSYDYVANSDSTVSSLAGVNVLVVEDDSEARQILKVILGERGALVRLAKNYDEAIEHFETAAPDVLVSDIGLPGRDGYDLMRELRRREAESHAEGMSAVALTAFARPKDCELALACGFNAHCPKPLRPPALVSAILKVMRGSA
jgi:PAS domain S-box-containing protein